jgi:hypothetical protein
VGRTLAGAAGGDARARAPAIRKDTRVRLVTSFEEGLDATQHVFELTRRNAEAMTQSCQRLERAAADTSRTLGETFHDASTRMQDVYARAERVRAA